MSTYNETISVGQVWKFIDTGPLLISSVKGGAFLMRIGERPLDNNLPGHSMLSFEYGGEDNVFIKSPNFTDVEVLITKL